MKFKVMNWHIQYQIICLFDFIKYLHESVYILDDISKIKLEIK